LVYLKFELALNEMGHRCFDSFACSSCFHVDIAVSSPRESHPQALSEPDVNLSAHPAPIIQS
jgi:hypothetical protein